MENADGVFEKPAFFAFGEEFASHFPDDPKDTVIPIFSTDFQEDPDWLQDACQWRKVEAAQDIGALEDYLLENYLNYPWAVDERILFREAPAQYCAFSIRQVSDLEDYAWCQLSSANKDEKDRADWQKRFAQDPVGCLKDIHAQVDGSFLDSLAVQEFFEGDFRKAANDLGKAIKAQRQGACRCSLEKPASSR